MNLRDTVLKVLREVDEDIRDHMLKKTKEFSVASTLEEGVETFIDREQWEFVDSPVLTIIEWQRMRNELKGGDTNYG